MLIEELKKQIRSIDLAVAAGRKRQSPRTKFVHDEDTMPIYENFCFAFALFRQKSTDSVTEGKELINRLLAFQTADGNFPVHIHDFPRCFDFQMSLKVAPILIYLLRLFSGVLGELKPKVEEALQKILSKRPEKASWENRYRACIGEPLLPVDPRDFSPSEWTEWLITAQLAGQTDFSIPYDETLQLFMGPARFDFQEKGEPRPNPVEWLLADGQFSPRLLRDHPHQILCAPLFPISSVEFIKASESSFRLFWKGTTIHSLVPSHKNFQEFDPSFPAQLCARSRQLDASCHRSPPFTGQKNLGANSFENFCGQALVAKTLVFDLPEGIEMGRGDLFEVIMFCDISPETEILLEGRKATTFKLGDQVTIQTPTKPIQLKFELTSGTGDFCGHIFRANRPSQVCKGYEAYDWQIGIRTLRRQGPAQIKVVLTHN